MVKNNSVGEKIVFSANGAETIEYPHAKKLTQALTLHYTQNVFKWIIYLDVRANIIRLLRENVGENLHGLGLGKEFLEMTLKS